MEDDSFKEEDRYFLEGYGVTKSIGLFDEQAAVGDLGRIFKTDYLPKEEATFFKINFFFSGRCELNGFSSWKKSLASS